MTVTAPGEILELFKGGYLTMAEAIEALYPSPNLMSVCPSGKACAAIGGECALGCVEVERGEIEGLYGRMPGMFQKLVRKIADAPNYDFAAMELLDAFEIEWRKP